MQENLNDKIADLKKELDHISFKDTESKEHIDEIIKEIESASEELSNDHNFLIDKIKTSIDRFETEHPRATAILNDIMVTLSNIGI
jgi:seryl-tRNA synthetase